MCSISCEYYLTRYYWITSEADHQGGNNVMHFVFRSGQRVFYKILQKLDARGVSKEVFVLKARKQGISTIVEGIISWMATFIPGVKAAIASADHADGLTLIRFRVVQGIDDLSRVLSRHSQLTRASAPADGQYHSRSSILAFHGLD